MCQEHLYWGRTSQVWCMLAPYTTPDFLACWDKASLFK